MKDEEALILLGGLWFLGGARDFLADLMLKLVGDRPAADATGPDNAVRQRLEAQYAAERAAASREAMRTQYDVLYKEYVALLPPPTGLQGEPCVILPDNSIRCGDPPPASVGRLPSADYMEAMRKGEDPFVCRRMEGGGLECMRQTMIESDLARWDPVGSPHPWRTGPPYD